MFIPYAPFMFKGSGGPTSWVDIVLALVSALIFIWFGLTIASWLMPLGDPKTLVQILIDQWKYITSLRIW